MKNLTLKSIGIFVGFWLIWNFAWIVAFFALMNSTPEHIFDPVPSAILIWGLGALTGAIVLYLFVNPIELKYNEYQKLSDEDLKRVSKKAINIPFSGLIIYAFIWFTATLAMFFVLKSGYGDIAANSIWVGGLAGLIACPFMVFGVMPLLFSNVNRSFSDELKSRNLTIRGIYMSIRTKLILVFGASILGLVIWLGGFAYYTGINQMIEEVKSGSLKFQGLVVKNINNGTSESVNPDQIFSYLKTFEIPENERLLVVNKQGDLLSQSLNKAFETKQNIDITLAKTVSSNSINNFYDNVNQNVLTSKAINDSFNLVHLINISKNTSRMGTFLIWFSVFLLVGLFVAITNSISMSSWIGNTIRNLFNLFEKLAKNDFSENATKDSEDELGDITDKYNAFILEVRSLINHIQITAQTLLAASQEISSNNQALTERTSQQASEVEELSAVLEQLSSTIAQNTSNTKETEQIANQSVDGITRSNQSVEETITAMKDITEKAMFIIDIAKKTDILAINAAIEAARAGQLGRGFAVVANEVRKLAENTKDSSHQIDSLTQSGIEVAEQSGKYLRSTVEQMIKTSELIKQVTEASIEQNSGIDQINSTVNQLNKISQENASTSEETASSSEELTAQANELFEIVSKFKI